MVSSTVAAAVLGAGEYGIMVVSMVIAVLLAGLGAIAYRSLEAKARR
jgi:ABC-type uncharacterized transport system permease subunit